MYRTESPHRGPRKRANIAASLGSWSAAHRKTAIMGWLMLVVVATLIGGMMGQKNLTDAEEGTGDSARAAQMLTDAGIKNPASEMVLVQSSAPGGYRGAADAVAAGVRDTGLTQNLGRR